MIALQTEAPGGVESDARRSLRISPSANNTCLKHRPDGWAVATRDGSIAAHFEHTVAVLEEGPQPLTVP